MSRPRLRSGLFGRSQSAGALVAASCLLVSASAEAAPERATIAERAESYARVIVEEVELRSGPGVAYRLVERAARGETFLVVGREPSGYWLEVVLADGRQAFVLGDAVERIALDEDSPEAKSRPGVFAPPALAEASGGFTLQGGVLDLDALAEVRPAWFLAPQLAFEPYMGLALHREGRRLLYGAALALNFAPDWSMAPYFLLGAGGIVEQPRDDMVRDSRRAFHVRAGGGILISLRWRMLVRLEATHLVRFDEDNYAGEQSYTAGLGTYF